MFLHWLIPWPSVDAFVLGPPVALVVPLALWLEDHLLVWITRVRSFVRGTVGSPAAERAED